MDDLDQKLLFRLGENVRVSTSELARALGVTRSTVQSRLKRLEQSGVIARYTLELGADYHQRRVKAHVAIKAEQKLTARVISALNKMPEIKTLYAVSGDSDLIAIVSAVSTESLSRLLDELAELPGIERTKSAVILETKFVR